MTLPFTTSKSSCSYCSSCYSSAIVATTAVVLIIAVSTISGAGLAFTNGPMLATAMTMSVSTTPPTLRNNHAPTIIPIFPLRKRVLLPSEELVLNLYEERYLQLAEPYLLLSSPTTTTMTTTSSPHRLIGAVPSTEKAQILPKGSGPIVPLFEPGDVGVVCVVTNASEARIPTIDGGSTRRIRLNCIALCRIELHEIISKGTTPPRCCTTSDNNDDDDPSRLPYITARYKWLFPSSSSSSSSTNNNSNSNNSLMLDKEASSSKRRQRDGPSRESLLLADAVDWLSSSSSSLSSSSLDDDEKLANEQAAILRQLLAFADRLGPPSGAQSPAGEAEEGEEKQSSSSSLLLLSRLDRMQLLRDGLGQ
jgi:ATP-dependent protease La (LON) substrate-binding domain